MRLPDAREEDKPLNLDSKVGSRVQDEEAGMEDFFALQDWGLGEMSHLDDLLPKHRGDLVGDE
ncbi:WYL domain-containing protein [Sesbania bispinosa]|nr:WYL domain-containing protein [Sesbania bispinosa]